VCFTLLALVIVNVLDSKSVDGLWSVLYETRGLGRWKTEDLLNLSIRRKKHTLNAVTLDDSARY